MLSARIGPQLEKSEHNQIKYSLYSLTLQLGALFNPLTSTVSR